MKDEFLTFYTVSEGYYMDRGSKFLSFAGPVENEEQALVFLQQVKKDHPKARHHCSAIRIFPDASLERSNDDGEPSGSAGKPILGQLIKHKLTNAMVIVTRYFGGTKLGVPGLIEAYKTSALNAIEKNMIVKRKVLAIVRLELSYEHLPPFINFCRQREIPLFEEDYKSTPTLYLGYSKSSVKQDLQQSLRDYSKMDFATLTDYAKHLDFHLEIMKEEKIL